MLLVGWRINRQCRLQRPTVAMHKKGFTIASYELELTEKAKDEDSSIKSHESSLTSWMALVVEPYWSCNLLLSAEETDLKCLLYLLKLGQRPHKGAANNAWSVELNHLL